MTHTAVDSEVLFWFAVALTVLLGMLISVVVRTPPEPSASGKDRADHRWRNSTTAWRYSWGASMLGM